jgi:ribosome maturation factor RimP
VLLGVEGAAARIRRDDALPGQPDEVLLQIEEMAEAKLVLTDALIAESLRRGKAAERAARRHGENTEHRAAGRRDTEARPNHVPPTPVAGDGAKNEGE